MTKMCKPEYLAKVQLLTKEEKERLLSRMAGKLPRRLEKDKLSKEEALAMQIELEDEQLDEWRKMMVELKKKEDAKLAAKSKAAEKSKSASKPKDKAKSKVAAKPKVEVKAKTAAKPKATVKPKTPAKPKATVKTQVSEKTKDEQGK